MSRQLTFVTGNPNKLSEFLKIIGEEFTNKVRTADLDLPEVQGSIEEVSKQKCISAFKIIGGPVLVEDTALCFNALNGMPGPFIKWFVKAMGPDALPRLLTDFNDFRAEAVCTFAYCDSLEKPVKLFTGITTGCIVSPRGPRDFGWDCIFQPDGFNETYSELDKSIKNVISHRYKALIKVKSFLLELGL
ncbi:Inosine triphosphate pyrophosphatase [Schistosoma japonicum]|nr:Inosine triphosphate pyrophosphatase [Schistosoma japonicum]KAH8873063.1 Inosine triphosphate pyrophosphatase [Schistosoma japonicum]